MTTTPPSYTSHDDDDEQKRFFNIAQNRVCSSLGYMYTYIGTEDFGINVLWV